MPWTLVCTADNTFDRIHTLQRRVARVETIVVAGGGLTGAETAGEISYQYGRKGKKEVYFIYNNELPFSPAVMESAYLPTTGMTPNTLFVPKGMLDKNGYIGQMSFLRADGYKNIFAVGDAKNLEDNRTLAADAQAGHLTKVLRAYFKGGSLPEYKVNSKTMYGIPLGKSKATGQMGNMKVFSWLIWWFKGRFLGTDKTPGINAAGKTTMSATFEK
ncbi:Ubiquitin [Metarhizium robertsii ARSEF 23]|uniref:Ubiquitin n=1 Tax=Metarhizium robertsii (strain ARSEF 23 / ATCC MYA-3075) TaxID=655844 RepID=A0A0B2XI68_METRA|nr:Ubiquitin [Metarhizium robertsii ARSEF 23]KHO11187.1 Ubiquitin [Metarhizium robertsii ARSEF 23]